MIIGHQVLYLQQYERNIITDRQWFYQTCSELGYFQTSDDPYEVFGQGFSTKFFWQECSDVFGPKYFI